MTTNASDFVGWVVAALRGGRRSAKRLFASNRSPHRTESCASQDEAKPCRQSAVDAGQFMFRELSTASVRIRWLRVGWRRPSRPE